MGWSLRKKKVSLGRLSLSNRSEIAVLSVLFLIGASGCYQKPSNKSSLGEMTQVLGSLALDGGSGSDDGSSSDGSGGDSGFETTVGDSGGSSSDGAEPPISIDILGPSKVNITQTSYTVLLEANGPISNGTFNKVSGPNVDIGNITCDGFDCSVVLFGMIKGATYEFQAIVYSNGGQSALSEILEVNVLESQVGGNGSPTADWCDDVDAHFSADLIVEPNGKVKTASGQTKYNGSNPHAWAVRNAGKNGLGRHILLRAGSYNGLSFQGNKNIDLNSGSNQISKINGTKSNPVVVRGEDGVKFPQNSSGDTLLFIGGGSNLSYIRFINIYMEASYRSGVLIGSVSDVGGKDGNGGWTGGNPYRGIEFCQCEIDGVFNHYQTQSLPGKQGTKWGILSWALKDFAFYNGYIHDIREEHAFYIHNSRGDIDIVGNRVERVGRTALQATARKCENDHKNPDGSCKELAPNEGNINFSGNEIHDTGIQPGDWHAGQSITITGRNLGVSWIQNNKLLSGFDKPLFDLLKTKPGSPLNGNFVSWTTGGDSQSDGYENSGELILSGNEFLYAWGAGNHTAVDVGAYDIAYIYDNTIQTGTGAPNLVVGSKNSKTHPTPDYYCIYGNTLTKHNSSGQIVPVHQFSLDGEMVSNNQTHTNMSGTLSCP